jgi:hypothetical protein
MPKVTITLPKTDPPETPAEQLVRLLGDLPVLPSGQLDCRTVTLTGQRELLVAALYMIYPGDGYRHAHEMVAQIEEVG